MTETKKKRGRPKKIKDKKPKQYEGVSHVVTTRGSSTTNADRVSLRTFQWVAIIDNNVIGFYKNPEEANAARLKVLAER